MLTSSPVTISTMRGEAMHIALIPSTMIVTSQKTGVYAAPATHGPYRTATWGTLPLRIEWL
jgi:hypothetical protein